MGCWELKPESELNPYECLTIACDDVLDFVNLTIDPKYEITEDDKQYLMNMIKDGFIEGYFDDYVELEVKA